MACWGPHQLVTWLERFLPDLAVDGLLSAPWFGAMLAASIILLLVAPLRVPRLAYAYGCSVAG